MDGPHFDGGCVSRLAGAGRVQDANPLYQLAREKGVMLASEQLASRRQHGRWHDGRRDGTPRSRQAVGVGGVRRGCGVL